MNNFFVNNLDERLQNIERDDFDCFTFDSLSIHELNRILKGKSVLLNRFLLNENEMIQKHKEKHILSKVRLIDNIVKNDPYTKAFLVFQTISWKLLKEKMPFILIPVRIFNEGTKIVRDGEAFVNPLLEEHIGAFEEVSEKEIFALDSSLLNKSIKENNGRLIYEMYLTHFKVQFPQHKTKVNKRFVTIDHKIDFLEKNNDLLPIDYELINIKKSVLSGNNTLINAKQGTRKVALLVNILAEFVARNKSILYVSEKNYRTLGDAIVKTGLSDFVEDVLNTEHENNAENTVENQIPFEQLQKTVQLLHGYQKNLLLKEKGVTLAECFAELVLLRDLPQKDGVVEFFDDLTEQDVLNINETLQKLQIILDSEQYIVPADLHWNDIDVRNTKYKEADAVKEINGIKRLLEDIQSIIKQVRSEFGIMLPTTYNDITTHVSNLDYMNSLQYPSSWFEGDAFEQAKTNVNAANSIAGRTLSLDTTLNMSYKKSIKQLKTENIIESLYGDFFDESNHKVMNKLLISKNYSLTEIEKFEVIVESLLYYKEEYEKMWKVSFEGDFAEFVIGLSKLINNELFKVRWLNVPKEEQKATLAYLNEHKKLVSSYLKVQREVQGYFSLDRELEEQFILRYIDALENNTRKTPEITSVFKMIDQHANNRFIGTRKTRKVQLLKRLLEYVQTKPIVDSIQEKVSTMLTAEIALKDYSKYISLFRGIVGFDNPYILKFRINRKNVAEMLPNFEQTYKNYTYIIKDSLFESMKDLLIEDLEMELEQYKKQAYRLMDVEEKVKGYFKNQPEYLTVQEIRTIMRTVENYQRNSKLLKENEANYSLWFGENYTGMTTPFKGIRVAIRNFTKFLSIFKNEESAVSYFKKREFKKVNELLYSLRLKLQSLEEFIEELNRFFVQPIVMNELHLLDSYLSQFASHKQMVQWIEFTDSLQNLRNYNQLRLASLINNGIIHNHIGEQFRYAFYEEMISSYYHSYDARDILGSMRMFNEQNLLVHKQRVLNIRTRRRKKIVLSNVSGINSYRSGFDLVIVDGAERIHSTYIQKLFSMGRSILVLFDEDSIQIDDSMLQYIKHQPMYEIENNYQISPYLIKEEDNGVLFHQQAHISNRMAVIDKVVELLTKTDKRVNVVCINNTERVEIYNMINTRLSKLIENQEEVLAKLYVLLYDEYIPSTDVTFILVTRGIRERVEAAVQSSLKNSREIIILDEEEYLSQETKENIELQLMDRLSDELDPLSKYVVDKLDMNFEVKKMISPYDFVVGEGNEIFTLVKIAFNNNRRSDILEETQILFDEEYASFNKFVIGIDELFFRHDEVINQLKEVINNGSSK